MKSIAFKNFRRFKELEPIEFAPITMLVGANNSGKSTVVKGILQMDAFMATPPTYKDKDDDAEEERRGRELAPQQKFYFNQNYYAHVSTAARALNKDAKNNVITFKEKWDTYECETDVLVENPKDLEAVYGIIERICLSFAEHNIRAEFNFREKKCVVQFLPLEDDRPRRLRDWSKEKNKEYNELIGDGVSCVIDISIILADRTYRADTLCSLLADYLEESIYKTVAPNGEKDFRWKEYNTQPIPGLSENAIRALTLMFVRETGDDEDRPFRFHGLYSELTHRYNSGDEIEYIYAHSVTQTSSYNVRDTNDYVVKTIHEFANSKRPRNSAGNKFIRKWMKEFGIGTNYHITPFGGEAYMVEIEDERQSRTQLSDKGMGSIQLMVLLFRLATIIDNGTRRGVTIILEEPEQNLHPQVQSKLADLFLDVLIFYGIWMIIETHSEYLIRRTQYLVATRGWAEGLKKSERFSLKEGDDYHGFNWNPFRVYYFPSEGQPYDMEYQENGKFAQRFGAGFFDEASNLELAIIRSNRK